MLMGSSSIIVLAIDHLGLLRVELQAALAQSFTDGCTQLLGFFPTAAMHDRIVGIPLKTDCRDVFDSATDRAHNAGRGWPVAGK